MTQFNTGGSEFKLIMLTIQFKNGLVEVLACREIIVPGLLINVVCAVRIKKKMRIDGLRKNGQYIAILKLLDGLRKGFKSILILEIILCGMLIAKISP